jgi:hypothetical protein
LCPTTIGLCWLIPARHHSMRNTKRLQVHSN